MPYWRLFRFVVLQLGRVTTSAVDAVDGSFTRTRLQKDEGPC